MLRRGSNGCDESGEEGNAGDTQDGDGQQHLNQGVSGIGRMPTLSVQLVLSTASDPPHRSTAKNRASRPPPFIDTATDCCAVDPWGSCAWTIMVPVLFSC